jgi:putative ATPase
MGYGENYRYPHDYPEAHVPANYLPEDLKNVRFYEPTDRGYEATLQERLKHWRQRLREELSRREAER